MQYDFKQIEPKWQQRWQEADIFHAEDNSTKPKFYALVEFPYPSGAGMHVGHIKAYTGLEVVARKRRMEGYNVLFPIGFDAFGLPAENYAIKTNTHPRVVTDKNIRHFTEQMKRVGYSFDWDRVIDTTEEDYYKWTQWIFLKMFENGLAFRDKTLVNYCPSCKVILSNEDSQGGKCDICHTDVVQKSKVVWYLRITKYADKLLQGLEEVDYPENIKAQQRNWIGRSEGAFVDFKVKNTNESMRIYTTRPDTLFGVTFMVVAPEHPLVDACRDKIKNFEQVEEYRAACAHKSEFERTQINKDKTGVRLDGMVAINPLNQEEIPIFIADYVMMGYGTGAIMAVPAHDQRDYDFAKQYDIPIREVILGGDISREAYTGDGEMVNSGFLNGYTNKRDSIRRAIQEIEKLRSGEAAVQYKMKDWAFNRQRYWGEPIPIVHCPTCGAVAVPYEELPLRLPDVEEFKPGENGEAPLARVESFVNCRCPKCGGPAKRETDTMPQWAGSSWYFLRYIDPHNEDCLADPEKIKYWMPVDWYNGGMEHVTRHMIYSRFWHHFLYDIGAVSTPEPYRKRSAQGIVLGSDGSKMSKSLGNVVDPSEVIDQVGADALRTYILFMGDYGATIPWSNSSLQGCKRFLNRIANLSEHVCESPVEDLEIPLHKCIKKVSEDIESMKYNTAIAAMMTFVNAAEDCGKIGREQLMTFIRVLSPFAPHMSEELWERLGGQGFISVAKWPAYDPAKTIDDVICVGVQVNGKLRGTISVPRDCDEESAVAAAKQERGVNTAIGDKQIVKIIYRPNKILSFVVK